ncbi:hypothetical protein GVAV_001231 [Gurleya vavrai]
MNISRCLLRKLFCFFSFVIKVSLIYNLQKVKSSTTSKIKDKKCDMEKIESIMYAVKFFDGKTLEIKNQVMRLVKNITNDKYDTMSLFCVTIFDTKQKEKTTFYKDTIYYSELLNYIKLQLKMIKNTSDNFSNEKSDDYRNKTGIELIAEKLNDKKINRAPESIKFKKNFAYEDQKPTKHEFESEKSLKDLKSEEQQNNKPNDSKIKENKKNIHIVSKNNISFKSEIESLLDHEQKWKNAFSSIPNSNLANAERKTFYIFCDKNFNFNSPENLLKFLFRFENMNKESYMKNSFSIIFYLENIKYKRENFLNFILPVRHKENENNHKNLILYNISIITLYDTYQKTSYSSIACD